MASDPKTEQLIKIARLYYLEEMNQRDIAGKMNMSLAGVSRSITRAKETGIVTISVNAPEGETSDLEIRMEKTFGLKECLLVKSSDVVELIYAEMAHRLAPWFDRALGPEAAVGVSWGQTLKVIGDNLPSRGEGRRSVVPIIGAMGRIETGLFPNSIARSFAEKLGGDAYLLNTPGVVDSEEIRASLMTDSGYRDVAEMWSRLDAVVLSLGGLGEETTARSLDVLSRDDLDSARAEGATMMANFLCFDDQGRSVDTPLSRRVISIDFDTLMDVPLRVIAAAGPNKIASVDAALKGGLGNVLVTDEGTAAALLGD